MSNRSPAAPRHLPTDFDRPVYCLLGIAFVQLDMPEVIAHLGCAVREGNRLVLCTTNVNHVVTVQRDPAYRDAVTCSDLVVPDGMPLVWLARLLGIRIHRVAGSDLFQALMDGTAGPVRAFFFGGPEGAAEAACDRLNRHNGPMRGAGWYFPGFGSVFDMSAPDIVTRINATCPDFVVVSLGASKGQRWIDLAGPGLSAPVVSHLGAVVNFVAGSVRRAPVWVQDLGLEWLWRIREEPALWRRFLRDGVALSGLCVRNVLPLLGLRILRAVRPVRSSARLELSANTAAHRLALHGDWLPADLRFIREALIDVTATPAPVVIDAARLGAVDHTFVALLIRLYGHQHKHGLTFVVERASGSFARQLRWHGADYLLLPAPQARA